MRKEWKSLVSTLVLAFVLILWPARVGSASITCPLWEIYNFGEFSLYYCDYYPDSCNDTPQADYIFDQGIALSPYCDLNCFVNLAALKIPGGVDRANKPPAPAPIKANAAEHAPCCGSITLPIEMNDTIQLPQGAPRALSRVLMAPDIQFIKVKGTETYLKVFVLALDVGQRQNPTRKLPHRFIYVAVQCNGRPTVGVVELEMTPIPPAQGEAPEEVAVYRGQYKDQSILGLLAPAKK